MQQPTTYKLVWQTALTDKHVSIILRAKYCIPDKENKVFMLEQIFSDQ